MSTRPTQGRYILAVDAAPGVGSVALIGTDAAHGTVLGALAVAMRPTAPAVAGGRGAEHDDPLMPAIADMLRAAELSVPMLAGIACGAGPGGFTSLRIAAALAKGLAHAGGIPLLAGPSLAWAAAVRAPARGTWLVTLDALRGEWYAAIVAFGATLAEAPRAARTVGAYSYLGVHATDALGDLAAAHGATVLTIDGDVAAPPIAAGAAALRACRRRPWPLGTCLRPTRRSAGAMGSGERTAAVCGHDDGRAMTIGNIVFRPARHADLDEIAAVERLAFSDPWSRNAFATLVANPAVLFLVAHGPLASGSDVGPSPSVLGYVVTWFATDESEIANIAVAPAARGTGVGAALLDAALTEAVHRRAAMTYLEVRESNTAARGLYASRGFVELGRRKNYYRTPREDALVLGRPTTLRAGRVSDGGVESAHPA